MTDREAMKMALDALTWNTAHRDDDNAKRHEAITALRQALAQPEQGPVAWQVMVENEPMKEFTIKDMAHNWAVTEIRNGSKYSYWIRPLYAAPPSKEWVGLTDEEMDYLWGITPPEYQDRFALARAVEAKLKEKNA